MQRGVQGRTVQVAAHGRGAGAAHSLERGGGRGVQGGGPADGGNDVEQRLELAESRAVDQVGGVVCLCVFMHGYVCARMGVHACVCVHMCG